MNTPTTKTMIPWHPVAGDIPPAGCEYDWADTPEGWVDASESWVPWHDVYAAPDWNPVIYAEHLKTPAFRFQIPLPPEYAVVIHNDAALRDAQAILDGLFAKGMLGTVDTAYVDYIGTAIGNYEDIHHAI